VLRGNLNFKKKLYIQVFLMYNNFRSTGIEKTKATFSQRFLHPITTTKRAMLASLIQTSVVKFVSDLTNKTTTTFTVETPPMTSKLRKLIKIREKEELVKETIQSFTINNDNFHIKDYCNPENAQKSFFQFVLPYDNTKFIQCTNIPNIYLIVSCPNNHTFDSYIGRCSAKNKSNLIFDER
jgi:hypothetical protein